MKGWTSGQILGIVGLVVFIAGIAIKADSAGDWAIGLGLVAIALLVGWWLTRFDRPRAPQPGAPPANGGALSVCSGCGTRSTGAKFCPACGKPFQPQNTCSHCRAQLQEGTRFCPECGTIV